MSRTPAVPIRRLVTVGIVLVLLSPAGLGLVGATSDGGTETTVSMDSATSVLRSVHEIRALLALSSDALEAGNRSMAVTYAKEPLEEQWPELGPRLSGANATLERTLETRLKTAESRAQNDSAAAYTQYLESAVYPLLDRAPSAVLEEPTLSNVTVNAHVVASLLERSAARYGDGVAENGSVTHAIDYRAAQAFADRAATIYEAEIRETVTDHAAAELDDLFSGLGRSMTKSAAPEEVDRLRGSITHELAEYAGIEAETAGDGTETIERIEGDLHEAVEAYEAGNVEQATSIVEQTYLSNVEGIEGTLIENDPDLVEELEGDFNEKLPGLMEANASVSEVKETVESIAVKLDRAGEILAQQNDTTIDLTKGTASDEPKTSPETNEGTTSTGTPGFGVLAAALALGLIALGRFAD